MTWVPGLRMVAVCNSLSMYASDNDSDIDLFIVSDPGRMWLTRIYFTVIFQLLGVRRHGNKVANRFCLSFFATTNALDFSKIAIEDDAYLKTWIKHLKPIVNIGGCYEEFLTINSKWSDMSAHATKENLRFLAVEKPMSPEWFGWNWNFLDRVCKWIFLPMTLREYNRLGKPWGILISDDMLKFHRNDRRKEVRDQMKNM
ncbi:MAG: hypothetical protein ACOYN2_00640 [Patescibacteria group bacterium]